MRCFYGRSGAIWSILSGLGRGVEWVCVKCRQMSALSASQAACMPSRGSIRVASFKYPVPSYMRQCKPYHVEVGRQIFG